VTRWLRLSCGLVVLAASTALVVLFLVPQDAIPEKVPIHWNAAMEPDGWIGRDRIGGVLFLFPGVMAGMIGLNWLLPKISPKKFEVETFRKVFDHVMFLVVCLFAVLMGAQLWAIFTGEMPGRVFVGAFFLFFALMGNVMGQVQRNFWMGVRTPWTLASEPVWIGTHRLAAWLWTAVGIAGFIAVLIGTPFLAAFAVLMIAALYPVVHSYLLYRRLEQQGRV
jgi:uncharacterized membrane protein